jgi:hypothetical protein
MKRLWLVFGSIFLLSLFIVNNVSANLPVSNWWSSLYIQNILPSSTSDLISMIAYPTGSSTTTYNSQPFNFGFGQGLVYDPGKFPNYDSGGVYIGFESQLPSNFEGSVVLSASVPVAAISTIANYSNGSVGGGGGTATARYQGMSSDQTDTRLMVPTIKNNFVGQTTTLYVQAAGADADVTITYNMADGGTYYESQVIGANKMYVFDPSTAGVPSENCSFDGNTSPCHGSAEIISTTGSIAATVVEHPHFGSPAGFVLSTRAQTANDQGIKLYHPTIKNNFYGYMDAGATIMNVGDNNALVKITLSVTNVDPRSNARIGNVYTDFEVIEPGKPKVFSKWRNNLGGMPSGTFAAAVIESVDNDQYDSQPLVGSTNDRKLMSKLPGGKGITLYTGFSDQNKSNSLAAPILHEKVNGITSSITVQNVGSVETDMTFTYFEYGSGNVYVFKTVSAIAPGKATVTTLISEQANGAKFVQISGFSNSSNFSELSNKMFSIIVTAEEPIFGLVSEYSISNARDIANYEAINFTSP